MSMNTKSSCVVRQVENGFIVVSAKYVAPTEGEEHGHLVEQEVYYATITDLLPGINAVFA